MTELLDEGIKQLLWLHFMFNKVEKNMSVLKKVMEIF